MFEASAEQQTSEAFIVAAQRLQLSLLCLNVEGKKTKDDKGAETTSYDELASVASERCAMEESRQLFVFMSIIRFSHVL